jgi:hypothetical protein
MGSTMSDMGSAFKNPNTFDQDPSGFSGSEWAARFLGAGAKGLGQGFQNMQQQGQQRPMGGGASPIYMPQQPQVDLSAAVGQGPSSAGQLGYPKQPARNIFFYGYGQ